MDKTRYAKWFTVVEVQQTFYQPPRISTLQKWRTEMPPDFEFTLKAWQLITHYSSSPTFKRLTVVLTPNDLRDCGGFKATPIVQHAWATTLECAEALSARSVLFQCPSSFLPTAPNLRNLKRFFSQLDRRGLRLLWEPRGWWPEHLVRRLCDELNLVHAIDPFVDQTVATDFLYYRLHGGKDYRHRFTDDELRHLAAVMPQDRPAYVMFNNISMFQDAVRFQKLLGIEFERNEQTELFG